jgi:hypothetical protein
MLPMPSAAAAMLDAFLAAAHHTTVPPLFPPATLPQSGQTSASVPCERDGPRATRR